VYCIQFYCDWLASEDGDPDVYALESGEWDDYRSIPEEIAWSERYLCLPANICKDPHADPAQGYEVVKVNQLETFPLFFFSTGADSKAIEIPLRYIYPFPTVGRYSYISAPPYYVAGNLQPPYTGLMMVAGEEAVFTVQAIDKLGTFHIGTARVFYFRLELVAVGWLRCGSPARRSHRRLTCRNGWI